MPSHIGKENQHVTGYWLTTDEGRGEDQQNPFWGPRRLLRRLLAMPDISFYFNFFNFHHEPWNHLLCWVLTRIGPIRSIGSVWRWIRYIWVGMNWGQNSVMSQFRGGGAEGSKTQKLLFFSQLIGNQKLYNISKNNSLSQLGGDI